VESEIRVEPWRCRARRRGTTGAEGGDLGDEEGGALEGVQLGYEEEGVEELRDNKIGDGEKSLRS
jgi:hypothetical protein